MDSTDDDSATVSNSNSSQTIMSSTGPANTSSSQQTILNSSQLSSIIAQSSTDNRSSHTGSATTQPMDLNSTGGMTTSSSVGGSQTTNNSSSSASSSQLPAGASLYQSSTFGPTTTTSSTTTTTSTSSSNVFVPLTRARVRENLDNQDVIDINNIEEEPGIQSAAKKARFSSFKLSEEEYFIFYDLIERDLQNYKAYLYIRNRILEKWFANVQLELLKEKAYQAFMDDQELNEIPQDIKDNLFTRCFNYLDRTGRINFGLLELQSKDLNEIYLANRTGRAPHMTSHLYKPPLKSKKFGRVIILGAGLSGLMAARQLQKFGIEVIILEARNRVGGRVHTYRKGNFIADLGPSSLNGVVGNPVVVLGKQLELMVMELRQKIPIYENRVDKQGQSVCVQVDPLLERAVEREYNKIMEGTRVVKNNYRIEKYQGKPFPVGLAVDWVMKLQEKNIKDDQIKHLQSIDELHKLLIESANKKLEKAKTIKKLHGEYYKVGEKSNTDNGTNHKDKEAMNAFNRRCIARDLDIATKEYKILIQQEEELHHKIAELTKCPPTDTYLSLSDRRLLDWHFAELEYALGCPISELGIFYEDDEEIFDGSHWMLVHGFNTIVEAMKVDLDIQLGTAVKKITVGKHGCKVLTYQPDHPSNNYVELTADAVLCTLPLGVLQDSIVPSQQAAAEGSIKIETNQRPLQKGYQPVIFSPPLPSWKQQSLKRLGCGNLNKIVLSFDKVFWDNSLHLFGVVNHKAVARGEFFLFWHHGRTPTLTGLISGEAADKIEAFSDLEILERCLTVLRSIYGNANVPAPRDYIVTKWRRDPWARGAWSYLQTGATGDDYDTCAEPVILESNEQHFKESRQSQFNNEKGKNSFLKKIKSTDEVPRLFFAGEHTTRYHFASAHGAVLTGLREAARIANIYLGCTYLDGDEPALASALPEWETFKSLHKKRYGSGLEESFRKSIYQRNKESVERFNRDQSDQSGFTMKLNQFSDKTKEELESMLGVPGSPPKMNESPEAGRFFEKMMSNLGELPESVDWRGVEGRVTEVGDEGNCKSCYAFSAIGALEGQMSPRNSSFQKLSVQSAIDCSSSNSSCEGGWMNRVWMDIGEQGGIMSEADYGPYVGQRQTCKFKKDKSVFNVETGYNLETGNEETLKKLVATFGPVSATVVLVDAFYHYDGGVFSHDNCYGPNSQGVLVVGYGIDPQAGDYWLVKNSWGKNWGTEGYFKIARNRNMCGIANCAMIPWWN